MDHLLFLHVHVYVIGFFSKWRKKRFPYYLREALYVHDRKKEEKKTTKRKHK